MQFWSSNPDPIHFLNKVIHVRHRLSWAFIFYMQSIHLNQANLQASHRRPLSFLSRAKTSRWDTRLLQIAQCTTSSQVALGFLMTFQVFGNYNIREHHFMGVYI